MSWSKSVRACLRCSAGSLLQAGSFEQLQLQVRCAAPAQAVCAPLAAAATSNKGAAKARARLGVCLKALKQITLIRYAVCV